MSVAAPEISVVVTTRNSARTLEACLKSIRAQSGVALELIVVDNGSTDATVAIAERYAHCVRQFGPERSAQRNEGLRCSAGTYVVFLDSDMVLETDVLATCRAAVSAGAHLVAIPEESFGTGFWTRCKVLERTFYEQDHVIAAARFFSRRDVVQVAGFDETLSAFEDWDLSLRVAAGRPVTIVDALIRHDEGRIRLRDLYRKKIYYGRNLPRFVRKHGSEAMRRLNPLRPSLLFNVGRIFRDPRLGVGLFLMKSVEMAGGLFGAALASAHPHGDPYAPRAGGAP